MTVAISLLIVLQVVVCLLLVLLVLMQRPKQEGLGAAFGGGMASDAFGAQATNVLQKITVWLAVIFFVNSLVMSVLYAKKNRETDIASGSKKPKVEAVEKKDDSAKSSPSPILPSPGVPTPGKPNTGAAGSPIKTGDLTEKPDPGGQKAPLTPPLKPEGEDKKPEGGDKKPEGGDKKPAEGTKESPAAPGEKAEEGTTTTPAEGDKKPAAVEKASEKPAAPGKSGETKTPPVSPGTAGENKKPAEK